MYETPKNNINDDDDEDKEPNDLRAKRTQTTTLDDDARVEGKIFLMRDEKTSPEEHESAAILFELMSGSARVVSQEGEKRKKRKKRGNATNNNATMNKNASKMMKKTLMTPMVTNTMKTTKRRLSAKFADVEETRARDAASAEKEKRKKREPKKEETTNASMMKREKQGQLQQRNMFMNDFVCKQLEADASVPKSWVAFARATARGEDAAVIEASTCLDDAEDEFKYFKSRRKTTATTTTSSKKKKNNENEDEDEDEENEAGVEDQNGVFIDAACRRARYSKGVTKLSADLIRQNPSAAWLECIAADAHDRARQIWRTKKRCEKMRKQSIAAMFRGKTMNDASAQSNREAAVEDVSAIALANICANWELGLAKEIELYCDQLENVELISEKAIAESTTPSSSEERTFSMEQFERSDDPEHQKAKRLATKLRTHSEKVAALWRHNAKGRNAF